jgi:prevent-host-death family protein
MAATRISATEAARNFSDLLSRVSYQGETFVITRGGEEMGRLSPLEPRRRITVRQLLTDLREVEPPDPDFGSDLLAIQADQPVLEVRPWES